MSGASVVLKTGLQGSGKTLSAVAELAALVKRWESHPDERRPLFVHGVADLSIDHAALPVYPLRGKPGDEYTRDRVGQPAEPVAVDWSQVPMGAHVLIDEAQRLFPPRPNNAPVPPHVAWFAMSRQEGCTVVLMTQAPTSIDIEVRKRCGLHQHYTKLIGSVSSVREWHDQVSTSLKAPTTVRPWKHDKSVFGLYRSAAVHTPGRSARVPLWVVVPGAALVAAVFFVPRVLHLGSSIGSGKGIGAPGAVAGSASAAFASASAAPLLVSAASAGPVVMASASGVGDVVPRVEPSASSPELGGCIASASVCRCFDTAGHLMAVEGDRCRASIATAGAVLPADSPPLRAVPDVLGVGAGGEAAPVVVQRASAGDVSAMYGGAGSPTRSVGSSVLASFTR